MAIRPSASCTGIWLLLLSMAFAPGLVAQTVVSNAQIDERVEALLALMTMEEKAGEMTQLTLQAVSSAKGTSETQHALDMNKLEEAILTYHVGSLLNVYEAAFTPAHWSEVITAVQDVAKKKRIPIPVIYGVDAVHGHHYMTGSTLFPQNLALAASWNPDLVRRANEITAYETRASGIPWNFSPVLDLGRQPLWSRFFETFGEDVYLATVLGVAAVEGLQGTMPDNASEVALVAPDRVAATGKHFLGYSAPLSGKDRTPAWIPERMLREYFLPSFVAAMEAGLKTVMINSGEINGIPVHASRAILTELLRDELGFEGVAVTDWEDIEKLHEVHRVAPTMKEAARMAVMAGIDMAMVPYDYTFTEDLIELVREGAIPESRLDESVRRILKLKFELGLFEDPYPNAEMLANSGSAAFKAESRTITEEVITLLKNEDDLLPLDRSAKVLVTGPGAASLSVLHGSWTYTWQGTDEAMYPDDLNTVVEALVAELGEDQVTYLPGASLTGAEDHATRDRERAVVAAEEADVAIVCLAELPSTEKPGDLEDLTLPKAQRDLVHAIADTGTPIVLVLLENRPLIVREVVDHAGAVIMAYQPGSYGGEVLADVLFGDVVPSSKLPFTYPRYAHSLVPYDHKNSARVDKEFGWDAFNPQWHFGHGLSYTTFAYSDLTVNDSIVGQDDTVTISVTVTNTGERAGKEIVPLYVRDLYATITPPVKRLRGFEKIMLEPGEARTVTFNVPVKDLAFIGLDNAPVVEPGDFEAMINDQTVTFTVNGDT